MAQHGIDMLGDRRPVLDAGEAMAAEISGDDVVGRTPALVDLLQEADRRLDAGARGQALSSQPSAVSRAES